jgi:RluA family pseudouridine synthase
MFALLYDTPDFIAVDKPEGLSCIPERSHETDNLLRRLQDQLSQKLFVVHRLDKEVSGVIIFARHADSHKYLNDLFAERQVQKTYLALVHGPVQEERGVIDLPIREYGSGRMGVDLQKGKASRTEFVANKRFHLYSLLTVHPHTGRRHQIRVHLYRKEHPIVGDLRYGNRDAQKQYPRLMLHANSISFPGREGIIITVESLDTKRFLNIVSTIVKEHNDE